MSIIKKTAVLLILSIFILGLTACNKSMNSNSSIVDNSINITTEEANDITEEVTADTVTESTKDSEESEDDTKKNSKASSKKKSKKTAKEATTESDNTAYKTDKKTESKSNKTNNKADNKSDKSNKASHKSNDKLTCSLKIECKEILDGNIDKLSVPKRALVPKDGIIYDNASVTFEKGDTVWDVLSKEVKKNSILMEYSYVPVYKTNYIEGIAGLYEFDAGDTSGWRYMVNGQYPAYGCDKYKLNNNDQIVWHYTVKLD